MAIDKKTRKKMKKAHKKMHKQHKHGKVSFLWSLAGEGVSFRGTGVSRAWGRASWSVGVGDGSHINLVGDFSFM